MKIKGGLEISFILDGFGGLLEELGRDIGRGGLLIGGFDFLMDFAAEDGDVSRGVNTEFD